jgi:peptide/nickel transport system permease protein
MATRPLDASRAKYDVSAGGSEEPTTDASANSPQHSRRRLIPNKKVGFGLGIVAAFCIVAVVAPPLLPNAGADNAVGMVHPNLGHLLGTTQTGQDVLAELLTGARPTLIAAFTAGAVATALAVLVGVTGPLLGGVGDELLSLLSNIFLVLPGLPILIVLAAYLHSLSPPWLGVIIGITGWGGIARILRAQTLSVTRRDFVDVAKGLGEGNLRIAFAEVVPNEVAVITSGFLFASIYGVLAAAGLAYIGIGSISQNSWGNMLFDAQNDQALLVGAWWWFVPPGLCLALFAMGLGLVNFGLDELTNPRLASGNRGKGRKVRPIVTNVEQERQVVARSSADTEALPAVDLDDGTDVVLSVCGLSVVYHTPSGDTLALNDVSFTVPRGAIVGIAGESGCGKTTLINAIAGLLPTAAEVIRGSARLCEPGAVRSTLGGADGSSTDLELVGASEQDLRSVRWDRVSLVLQSSMNSLNPVLKVGDQLRDVFATHRPILSPSEVSDRCAEAFEMVGLDPQRLDAYPHEMSGGMRQRAVIAMALLLRPDLVIMDEPTTALDVVVQRDILSRVMQLQGQLGMSVLFVTHDLSLLGEISEVLLIMYAGRIVEANKTVDLFREPLHPYTRALLGAFPSLKDERRPLAGLGGAPPDPRALPPGCEFAPRCRYAEHSCTLRRPPLFAVEGFGTARAACQGVVDGWVPTTPRSARER